ncbi:PAS domain S-box protein [bacterium]|nr:PAS domain S-box protein [bacterium]
MDTQEFWDDYQHLKKEVSKLRDSESRLKAIRARYRSILNTANDIVAVIDRNGKLVEMNRPGLKLLGLSTDAVVGYPVDEAFQDDRAREIGRRAAEAISSNSEITFDWTIPQFAGPALWLTAKAAPVEDETRRIVAAVVVARNLTDMLSLDEDLAQAQDLIADLRRRVRDQIDAAQG